MDRSRIAAAFSALAEEFGTPDASPPAQPAPAATPTPRGRGRPAKQSPDRATAPAASPAAPAAPDPFDAPAPAAPIATLDEVRTALTALKAATSQDNALAVLKVAGGADNLTSLKPEKYGEVVAAAKRALGPATTPVEDDPFAVPATAPAETAKPVTLEDLKAAVVEATKRTGQDRAAKVVMDLGGKAPKADGSGYGPSWTALPKEKYAEAIAQLKALPATK
jgi:hypothetical protein